MKSFEEPSDPKNTMGNMPIVSAVRSGRQECPVYLFFCQHFMKCVTSSTRWQSNYTTAPMCTFTTCSDEAFAVAVYENNYDRWMDMYKKGNTKTSDVPAKWTNSGQSIKNGQSKKYCGWSQAGIDQYNLNYSYFKTDRQLFRRFDRDNMELWAEAAAGGAAKKAADDEAGGGLEGDEPMHDLPWSNATPAGTSHSGSSEDQAAEEEYQRRYVPPHTDDEHEEEEDEEDEEDEE
jgi:hypothetical protein